MKTEERATMCRVGLCGVAAFFNAIHVGIQGNGNLIWSGMFIGFVIGLIWSSLLLFGIPKLTRNFQPRTKTMSFWASLLVFAGIVTFICLQIWR